MIQSDAITWALMKRLPAPQKSTLLTLARRYPLSDFRIDSLAHESGLSRSGIKLSIAALEESGLISVERKSNAPNVFTLHLGCKAATFTDKRLDLHTWPICEVCSRNMDMTVWHPARDQKCEAYGKREAPRYVCPTGVAVGVACI